MAIPVETIFLDPDSERTLQHQIQEVVTDAILSGRFRSGEKMPSTRALSRHLHVARNTVALAFTELVSNGYLMARGRSGYFISPDAPRLPQYEPAARAQDDRLDWDAALTYQCPEPSLIVRPPNWRDYKYPFIYGQSDPRLFDYQNWRLCALQALGKKDFGPLTHDYYESDDPVLVEYILRHILPRRGIMARPENILLTMGSQNALWIIARLLLSSDRVAATENPGYPDLRPILRDTGCAVRPIPVDGDGIPPDAIPEGVNVVFTTASHQSPTGVTMPLERRKALLARAEAEGFVIVEDDYEFEMAFQKAPSPALKSLDRHGFVIYTGSFSKSLFPGLRLGYMVAPEPFLKEARALRAMLYRHPPGLIQRTTAYFLSLGYYDAQIERMGRAFRKRRMIMEQAIQEHGLDVVNRSVSGGSSFWLRAPAGVDTADLAMRLRDDSVLIEPGHTFFAPGLQSYRFYRLAYSSIASAQIPDGIAAVARTQRSMQPR